LVEIRDFLLKAGEKCMNRENDIKREWLNPVVVETGVGNRSRGGLAIHDLVFEI